MTEDKIKYNENAPIKEQIEYIDKSIERNKEQIKDFEDTIIGLLGRKKIIYKNAYKYIYRIMCLPTNTTYTANITCGIFSSYEIAKVYIQSPSTVYIYHIVCEESTLDTDFSCIDVEPQYLPK